MEFLESDLKSIRGFGTKSGKPKTIQKAVALTGDGRPVFGARKIPSSTLSKMGFMAYDDEVERQRRMLADTVLAQIILQKPRYVQKTLDSVSGAIGVYWGKKSQQFDDATYTKIIKGSTKYLYGKTSYGRFYDKVPDKKNQGKKLGELKGLIQNWFSVLNTKKKDIPKIMNLHDHFLRLFLRILGPSDQPLSAEKDPAVAWGKSPEYLRYKSAYDTMRPAWYSDRKARGRVSSGPAVKGASVTSMPGLLTLDFTIPISAPMARCGLDLSDLKMEDHMRGIDMFVINATIMNLGFKESLTDHNLPFSASASGTTSTLFMSAATFADLSNLEAKKQYLLACVAYLVGGGMHTCHEVFWTGRFAGVKYQDSKYYDALPKSFTSSRDYDKWSAEFWDIVRTD